MIAGLLVLIFLAFIVLLLLASAAALVGVTGAMFFDAPFSQGWDVAWDRPLLLTVYAGIAVILASA